MLRTALIGFGKIADTLRHDARMARYFPDASHAQILQRHPAFDWVAVVDPSEEARSRCARDWGIEECVADVTALPDRETITAAVIASPPGSRVPALDALPSLQAILLEKPVGSTPAEAEAFVRTCKARGIVVQVNYWRRAVPMFLDLAKGGLSQKIGDVQAVFGLYGNGLLNNGSHLIDFVRMLCGEIDRLEGCGRLKSTRSPVPGDANAACLMRLQCGASLALSPVDFTHWREVGLDIWGKRGRVSLMQESLTLTTYPLVENRGLDAEMEIDSGNGEISAIDVSACLTEMYDTLAAAASGNGELVCPVQEASKSESVIHNIMQQAR